MSFLLVGLAARADTSGPRIVVEVDRRDESTLDARNTKRLIELEVSDIDVPPMAVSGAGPRTTVLFFRVVEAPGGSSRVELWERGRFHGERTISASRGSARLLPRRIALAAAELARRLRQQRLGEARRFALEQKRRRLQEEAARRTPPFARTAFSSSFDSAWTSRGELWLVGPRLGAEVRFGSGFRLAGAGSWRFGQVAALTPAPSAQWFEVEAGPGLTVPMIPGLDFGLDARAAASMFRLADGATTDGVTQHSEEWSARVGISAGLEWHLSRKFRLGVAPTVGALLHPVRVLAHGKSAEIGGFWLGATVSFVVDPNAR